MVLAYLLQMGVSVVPKTANPKRLEENLGALEVSLDAEDIAALDGVQGERMSGDPLTFPGDVH